MLACYLAIWHISDILDFAKGDHFSLKLRFLRVGIFGLNSKQGSLKTALSPDGAEDRGSENEVSKMLTLPPLNISRRQPSLRIPYFIQVLFILKYSSNNMLKRTQQLHASVSPWNWKRIGWCSSIQDLLQDTTTPPSSSSSTHKESLGIDWMQMKCYENDTTFLEKQMEESKKSLEKRNQNYDTIAWSTVLYPMAKHAPITEWTEMALLSQIETVMETLVLQKPMDLMLVRVPNDAEWWKKGSFKPILDILENQVLTNKIQKYGLAFSKAPSRQTMESMPEMGESSKWNNLSAWQFPVNAYDMSAVTEGTIRHCKKAGLLSIADQVHETLNARGKPVHLVDQPHMDGNEVAEAINTAMHFALQLEEKYAKTISPSYETKVPSAVQVGWANILRYHVNQIETLPEWIHIRDFQILPQLNLVREALQVDQTTKEFAIVYVLAIRRLIVAIQASFQLNSSETSLAIVQQMDLAYPVLQTSPSLSDRAVWMALSTDVDCVLTGENVDSDDILTRSSIPIGETHLLELS